MPTEGLDDEDYEDDVEESDRVDELEEELKPIDGNKKSTEFRLC